MFLSRANESLYTQRTHAIRINIFKANKRKCECKSSILLILSLFDFVTMCVVEVYVFGKGKFHDKNIICVSVCGTYLFCQSIACSSFYIFLIYCTIQKLSMHFSLVLEIIFVKKKKKRTLSTHIICTISMTYEMQMPLERLQITRFYSKKKKPNKYCKVIKLFRVQQELK